MACSTCTTDPCACGLTVPIGPRGFTGEAGPPPTLTFAVTTLAPGSNATVNQTGGAGVYTVSLGIPRGATGTGTPGTNGTNGLNAFTTLTATFIQPSQSFPVTIGVVDSSWAQPGQWVFVPGGGYYIVATVPSSTSITLTNPGAAQGFASGVPGNAAAGSSVGTAGTGVTPGGRPGIQGETGAAGDTGDPGADALLLVTTTAPVSAPPAGQRTVIYTDSATTPTFTRIMEWDGAAWNQAANIQGAAGTIWVSTPGDPSVTLPSGPIGTYVLRTDVPSIYVKTGASTFTLQSSLAATFTQVATTSAGNFGAVPVRTESMIGFDPNTDTHTAPGTYTFDLQYQSTDVAADKDIELDWDDTAYGFGGMWTFSVENTDGSPINLTLAASQWTKKTGLTIPATIAAGATQFFVCYKSPDGASMLIADTFVITTA